MPTDISLPDDPRQFAEPLSNATPMLACGGEMMGFAYAQPILRSFGAYKRFAHALRVVSDDGEMGAGGLVGLAAALLPVAQYAERDAVARGEFLLRQTERPAQCPDARDAAGFRQLLGGERTAIGTGVAVASISSIIGFIGASPTCLERR